MNELIERMTKAKAISNEQNGALPWEALNKHAKQWHYDEVIAMLKVMREPTDDYCIAIVKALGCKPDKLHLDAVRNVHRNYIDAALQK